MSRITSNWKLLVDRSNTSQERSMISVRSKGKYTPRRNKDDDFKSPGRFNNLSVSKIQDSQFSGEEMSGEESSRLKSFNILESRLKNCASQLQLRKAFNENNKEESQGQLGNLSQTKDINKIQVGEILQKNMVYDRQIKKIKKEFAEFQQIIFKELEKQEKMLNCMIEQILNKIQQGTLEGLNSELSKSQVKFSSFKDQPVDFLPQNTYLSQIKGEFTARSYKLKDMFESNFGFGTQRDKAEQTNGKKKSHVYFGKFFEAMDNLKRDMKQLSEVSSIISPRSLKNKNMQMNWEQVVQRLKTED